MSVRFKFIGVSFPKSCPQLKLTHWETV